MAKLHAIVTLVVFFAALGGLYYLVHLFGWQFALGGFVGIMIMQWGHYARYGHLFT